MQNQQNTLPSVLHPLFSHSSTSSIQYLSALTCLSRLQKHPVPLNWHSRQPSHIHPLFSSHHISINTTFKLKNIDPHLNYRQTLSITSMTAFISNLMNQTIFLQTLQSWGRSSKWIWKWSKEAGSLNGEWLKSWRWKRGDNKKDSQGLNQCCSRRESVRGQRSRWCLTVTTFQSDRSRRKYCRSTKWMRTGM